MREETKWYKDTMNTSMATKSTMNTKIGTSRFPATASTYPLHVRHAGSCVMIATSVAKPFVIIVPLVADPS
jgi:hypothetical protein